jgi:hypothetical protein
VSSWEAKAIYRGPAAGPFTEVAGLESPPTSLGQQRNRPLVPLFMKDTVASVDVK